MSIASEITRLRGVKVDILQAIADKGVVVPEDSALGDCPDLIASISGGGGGEVTTRMIDSEVGIKVVDVNGYVGDTITNYFPHVGNTYYNNFALVLEGVDYSQKGLGQVRFITPGTSDIGGRTYRTVNIGGVTWMAENLDFKFSGCNIPSSGMSATSDPQAAYYNYDEATYGWDGRKCGLLYNWYAAKLLDDNKDTLCPGWHVATNAEWADLMTAVGGTGPVLKSTADEAPWATSSWAGTNDYGFTVLPGGYFANNNSFSSSGSYCMFWTSTSYDSSSAYRRGFSTGTGMDSGRLDKSYQFSIRLVKD